MKETTALAGERLSRCSGVRVNSMLAPVSGQVERTDPSRVHVVLRHLQRIECTPGGERPLRQQKLMNSGMKCQAVAHQMARLVILSFMIDGKL